MQGKVALAELKAMIASAYFPTETNKAVQQFRSSAFDNANEALVRGFVDQLIFGFLTEGDNLFQQPQVAAALNAAFEMYPGGVEERMRKQLNTAIRDVSDDVFSGLVHLVANLNQAWSLLDDASKDKVIQFIESGPIDEVLGGLDSLSRIDSLEPAVGERLNNLDFDDLVVAIESIGLGSLAKGRALHFLSEVRSWDRANEVFSRAILPLFGNLTEEDICRIIRMPTEHGADLLGAHGYSLFINKVIESEIMDRQDIAKLLSDHGGSYMLPQDED